jgi:hypothetical protein
MKSTKNTSSTQILKKRYTLIHSVVRVGFCLCINSLVHTRGNFVGHTWCLLLGWAKGVVSPFGLPPGEDRQRCNRSHTRCIRFRLQRP